jgi:hypothetical protein
MHAVRILVWLPSGVGKRTAAICEQYCDTNNFVKIVGAACDIWKPV